MASAEDDQDMWRMVLSKRREFEGDGAGSDNTLLRGPSHAGHLLTQRLLRQTSSLVHSPKLNLMDRHTTAESDSCELS